MPRGALVVLDGVDNLRDVAKPDRAPGTGRDNEIAERLGIAKLRGGIDDALRPPLERASRGAGVGRSHGTFHLVHADATPGQGMRIELNPHRIFLTAGEGDLADACNCGEARRGRCARTSSSRAEGKHVAFEDEQDDRGIRRVELAVDGRVVISVGNRGPTRDSAAWTSVAAISMSRSSANSRVIEDAP